MHRRVSRSGSKQMVPWDMKKISVLSNPRWLGTNGAKNRPEHRGGVLLHHRLGNISLIGLLRSELQRDASCFPILLGKVLYSGTHAGDFLEVNLIPPLKTEVETLAGFKCSQPKEQCFLTQFQKQMSELISASLSVNKPIAF